MNEFLNGSSAQLILFICAVVSLVFGIVMGIVQFRKRIKKEVYYLINSYELIRGGIDRITGVSLVYKGEPIDNLSVAKIAIWNTGNISILKSDIVPASQLRITVDDSVRFLDQRVVSQVDESNHFTITDNDQTSLHLDFDYFGKSSGVVVQVLYTGVRENIELDGKIIDGKIYGIDKPKKTNSWVIKVLQNRSFRRWIFIGVMTLLMAMTLLQYLLLFQVISKEWFVSSPFYTDSSKLNFLPTTIAYSLLSLSYIMLYLSIFCSKLKKCPAELRKHIFLDEFFDKEKER